MIQMLLKQVSTSISCTPPPHIPACFHTCADSRVIVFGNSLYRFTFLHDKSLEYMPPTRSLASCSHGLGGYLVWNRWLWGQHSQHSRLRKCAWAVVLKQDSAGIFYVVGSVCVCVVCLLALRVLTLYPGTS
jgi:hypothetical protein